MKAKVLFGSKSDEFIYSKIVKSLEENNISASFEVCSAHRNPQRLQEILKADDFDFVVAGAGLAAHLPGVCASLTKKLVFGVSVDGCFGGLDAFLSIVQMPFGVPVVTFGQFDIETLSQISSCYKSDTLKKPIQVVVDDKLKDYEYYYLELARLKELAQERNVELSITNRESMDNTLATINFVHEQGDVLQGMPAINVQVLDKTVKSAPSSALNLMALASKGGAWCGVNNSRNALLSFLKIGE